MKQVVLNTSKARTPQEVYAVLEREGLEPGDSLTVMQMPMADQQMNDLIFLLALVAVLWFMQRKRQNDRLASELLDDLFKNYKSAEELEKELREEFQVSVTTESGASAHEEWPHLAMSTYERVAYDEDEPDISQLPAREPNPEYRPWKKEP